MGRNCGTGSVAQQHLPRRSAFGRTERPWPDTDLMKHYQSNSGDQFSADDGDSENISGALSQPRCRYGRDPDGYRELTCSHVKPVLIPMQFVLVFARNGPEPENAPIVAFAFQSGNGPVMLLVAPARTIFFVEQRRARGRQGGIRCMCRGKQVERPVEKRQGGHC
jgi:hypothetical protein